MGIRGPSLDGGLWKKMWVHVFGFTCSPRAVGEQDQEDSPQALPASHILTATPSKVA